MKKGFIKMFKVSILIYAASYLIFTFVEFRIVNPFQWIIDIPTYSTDARAAIIFGWIVYACCFQVDYFDRMYDKHRGYKN